MKVLVACEESQEVLKRFREKGHEAYSCDIIDCSGGFPEWHIKHDVSQILHTPCAFFTMDYQIHEINHWDMIIAFPPCTYLTVTGNKWFDVSRFGEKAIKRVQDRTDAINFFLKFVNADCERIAIENPIGVMSTHFRKPNQIIQPYQFGDPERKSTCLWLKGLPNLIPTDIVEPDIYVYKKRKRHGFSLAHENNGVAERRKIKTSKQNFPWNCSSYGRSMGVKDEHTYNRRIKTVASDAFEHQDQTDTKQNP